MQLRYPGRVRAFLALLATIALAASGCSSGDEAVRAQPVAASTATIAPSTDAPSTTRPEPVSIALPTGREAIAAAKAEGSPYVLWFWGAH